MTTRTAIVLIIIALVSVGFLYRDSLIDLWLRIPRIEKATTGVIEEIKKEIVTPPPLRATREVPEAFLTRPGVISWTNAERKTNGLPALAENALLDRAATLKLDDMFGEQYFNHVSPAGFGPDHWVGGEGYKYIVIGENLALGNFENDKALVQAWMESPGHRANILNSRYQEIGVAVGRGIFEGRSTWLAVQVFGLPLSSCPQPDENVKATIDANETQLAAWQTTLEAMRLEIESTRPKRGPDYQEKMEAYNALVSQYNALLTETRRLIDTYNSEVKTFNVCVAGQ